MLVQLIKIIISLDISKGNTKTGINETCAALCPLLHNRLDIVCVVLNKGKNRHQQNAGIDARV